MADRKPSPQTQAVLAVLAADPANWQHGYRLAQDTDLKSGTLYPILMRLADRGLVEARWEDAQPEGRPRRHLYRLTAAGVEVGGAVLAEQRRSRSACSRPVRPRTATNEAL
jgi:DNA-binding PadR family transcriptional regulator